MTHLTKNLIFLIISLIFLVWCAKIFVPLLSIPAAVELWKREGEWPKIWGFCEDKGYIWGNIGHFPHILGTPYNMGQSGSPTSGTQRVNGEHLYLEGLNTWH
jgi:hypothetical protein